MTFSLEEQEPMQMQKPCESTQGSKMSSKIKKAKPSKPTEISKPKVTVKMSKKSKNTLKSRKRLSDETFAEALKEDKSLISLPKKKKVCFADSVKEVQSQIVDASTTVAEADSTTPETAPVKWRKKEKSEKKSVIKHNLKSIKKPTKPFTKTALATIVKPNWKDIKEKHVELKKQRKEKKVSNYDMILEAKKLWEQVRRVDCPAAKKAQLIVSLHTLVKDNIDKIVFAHDTSRIVQWLVKLGSPAIRSSVCESLCPVIIEMMQKRFSSHCVRNVLKYGDKDCMNKVMSILSGNVMKLITNNVSAPLLERIYSEHASSEQKKSMEQEFFGNSWKISVGPEIKSLKETVSISSEIKKGILLDTKENIIRVINKNIVTSSLVHTVILQFFDVCTPEDKEEILGMLSSHIIDLLGTKAGTRISMQCCWYSSKKTKKSIIKQLKGKVSEVSTMEEGFWLILAILDAVDDTVLLKKVIVSEILNNVINIIKNENGRKVVLYLVSHRDKSYFHPNDIALLEQGDNSDTVLKSLEARRSEILPVVLETLLQSIKTEISTWMHDASVAMVSLAVLKAGSGKQLKSTLETLATLVCSDIKIQEIPIVEDAGIHLVLKKLLKFDQIREDKEEMFSYHLACQLNEGTLRRFIACNRGCFLLVNVLETGKEESKEVLLGKIKGKIRELINAASSTGAKVLNKIITEHVPSTPDLET